MHGVHCSTGRHYTDSPLRWLRPLVEDVEIARAGEGSISLAAGDLARLRSHRSCFSSSSSNGSIAGLMAGTSRVAASHTKKSFFMFGRRGLAHPKVSRPGCASTGSARIGSAAGRHRVHLRPSASGVKRAVAGTADEIAFNTRSSWSGRRRSRLKRSCCRGVDNVSTPPRRGAWPSSTPLRTPSRAIAHLVRTPLHLTAPPNARLRGRTDGEWAPRLAATPMRCWHHPL